MHSQRYVCVEKAYIIALSKYHNNEYISQDVRSVIGLYT